MAEESLTQASVQTPSQPFPGWMTKPALPVWRPGVPADPSIKNAWIILHSFIHSDTFIFMIGTYSVFSSALFNWQHNAYTGSLIPCPGTHNDCISNSVILSNDFCFIAKLSMHTNNYEIASQTGSHSFWVSGYECLARLQSCEKSDGVVHCSVQNAAVSCVNQCERVMQYWASPSEERRKKKQEERKKKEERRKKEERKTFGPFCKLLVWYLCNAFSRHWESCWSWKHWKLNGTLLSRLINLPFFWDFEIFCFIIHLRHSNVQESMGKCRR